MCVCVYSYTFINLIAIAFQIIIIINTWCNRELIKTYEEHSEDLNKIIDKENY